MMMNNQYWLGGSLVCMKENTSDWTPLDSGSSESKEGLEYFDIYMKKNTLDFSCF